VPGDNATFKETTDLLTSATARVGYAWDRWLPYVKGGAAWAGDRYSVFDAAQTYDAEGLETRFGWTAGAGIEWAFWDNWSVKLEYDYYGFGTRSVTFIDNITGTVGPMEINQNIQVVKLGLNFHVPAWLTAP
jgi:outer membrane immunogenic protein